MSRGYLVLDIETVPDPELYTPPDQPSGTEKPFPPLYAHRPIVIGVLWLDELFGFKRIGVIGEHDDEPAMLSDFSSFVEQWRPHLVTFNGRSFDLPVIMLRCLRHGVPLHFFFNDRDYRYRYTDAGHIDLYDFLSEHGAARVGSLDAVAHVIGLPGKVGVDGSQVEGLYHAGQIQAIKNYCLMDVTQTAFVLLRYRLLQGALDRDSYRRVAQGLFESLAADGRVNPVLERIDQKRLLFADTPLPLQLPLAPPVAANDAEGLMARLPRSFFARPCLEVAPELLGLYLVHGERAGRIVEVEAYVHEEDQACHARFGRTKRNEPLYGPPGHAYVFLIYGMYDCFNVVCEPRDSPAAVLIRALEPVPPLEGGTDGPGKLCRALAINRAHNGVDLVSSATVWLERRNRKKVRVAATPRIGVDYAGEWAARPWRFVDADSPWLSKKLKPPAPPKPLR